MTTMPPQYYSRFDPAKQFEEHLFISGRGLQSAELNEIQKSHSFRLKGVADALFKDGDIIRDASVQLDDLTGVATCQAGAIYVRGAVRGIIPATFTLPVTGEFAIGIRLTDTVVTQDDDPSLRDPATGTRNYDEPGAARLKTEATWGWSGDTLGGEFYPVYAVKDGLLSSKEPPPAFDPLIQALARYDRDSAGGCYIISGLQVRPLADEAGVQVYSLSEGRARVYGYAVELTASRRVRFTATADLRHIANEPHLSTTSSIQRILFDRSPATNLSQVSITAEKTATLTHGVFSGAQDTLPDTSVLSIIEVKQGATTYTATADYLLTAGRVDWTPAGAEPAPGSTYTVKYRYITLVTPTAVDDFGFSVTGAVSGTLVLATYDQKLPRYDRLCLRSDGSTIWVAGVASDTNRQLPPVPPDTLPLATIDQSWLTNRTVSNNGVKVVPMSTLAAIDSKFDYVMQLLAQQRLESDIHTREAGTKKGLFTDPFTDESQRDAGISQTAAIVRGELVLPISSIPKYVSADVTGPTVLNFTTETALEQPRRTGSMNINPYQSFAPVPAVVTLTPNIDRWTDVVSSWLSPVTIPWSNVTIIGGALIPTTGPIFDNSSRDILRSTSTRNLELLRQIPVAYRIEGFGPGEALASITFDGIPISFSPVVANSQGVITGTFTIPANVSSGAKEFIATSAGGAFGGALFTGQGTEERRVWQQEIQLSFMSSFQSAPPAENNSGGFRGFTVGPASVDRATHGGQGDPLAQTFTLNEAAQIAGIDLWFTARPTTTTRVQIRDTSTGLPTQRVLAQAVIAPSAINLGGATTRLNFLAPQTLQAGIEYAIVVLCDDPVGAVSVAELGKFDENAQVWITSQPYTVGVLLSSSNASTWTPHQDRDLAFRLVRANYTQTSRVVPLGTVPVTDATDLMLMSFADLPVSGTFVDYTLTLPDSSILIVTDGQPVPLSAAITGNVAVAARLTGVSGFSPCQTSGTQLLAGTVATSADYVSRAIPGGSSVTIKVIFEAAIPSGATIDVLYSGIDVGDTYTALTLIATSSADDGFVEFVYQITGVNEQAVHAKLVLHGTAAARPRVRDLRVIVM